MPVVGEPCEQSYQRREAFKYFAGIVKKEGKDCKPESVVIVDTYEEPRDDTKKGGSVNVLRETKGNPTQEGIEPTTVSGNYRRSPEHDLSA